MSIMKYYREFKQKKTQKISVRILVKQEKQRLSSLLRSAATGKHTDCDMTVCDASELIRFYIELLEDGDPIENILIPSAYSTLDTRLQDRIPNKIWNKCHERQQ